MNMLQKQRTQSHNAELFYEILLLETHDPIEAT